MQEYKSKKGLSVNLWLVALFFMVTNFVFLGLFFFTITPSRSEEVRLYIPSGSSVRQISDSLTQNGVIGNPYSFEILSKLRGLDTSIRAGTYHIPPGLSLWQIIDLMQTGRGEQVKITIPEGLTDDQIAQRLAEVMPSLDSLRLKQLMKDPQFLSELGHGGKSLMGYLFPSTYFLPATIDEKGVLTVMYNQFQDEIKGILADNGQPQNGLSLGDNIILASIVEKEAVAAPERPIIAGVFINRLELKRPLESCATVLFVLGKHKSRLLYRDLKVKSPYNTYLNRGLPPGPICNPGKASIIAALRPTDTDYLYFVARGDGTHVFSRTLQDHNRAKRRAGNPVGSG